MVITQAVNHRAGAVVQLDKLPDPQTLEQRAEAQMEMAEMSDEALRDVQGKMKVANGFLLASTGVMLGGMVVGQVNGPLGLIMILGGIGAGIVSGISSIVSMSEATEHENAALDHRLQAAQLRMAAALSRELQEREP